MSCHTQIDTTSEQHNYYFPFDWMGHWEGFLRIYNTSGRTQEIPMGLQLATLPGDSVFQWTIMYGTGEERDQRSYLLKAGDIEKGQWIIDEDNGILLDGYVIDNGFYLSFEVGNNRIETSYVLQKNSMYFENKVASTEMIRKSGGMAADSTEIPDVLNYEVKSIQKAMLQRKSKI